MFARWARRAAGTTFWTRWNPDPPSRRERRCPAVASHLEWALILFIAAALRALDLRDRDQRTAEEPEEGVLDLTAFLGVAAIHQAQ